ncbi:unnamed protein product [Schistosoma margrebowiei]|uniref:Uncharacterized protein n=1 Tax=Schistosoma margrebowiei TaxID=48269 RepID=A0A183N5H6_9TREM|nr:unnamed protein product [Schistosoma margrebowiei]
MWKTRKISRIATEMRRYKLAVLGISETHWTQAGQQRTKKEGITMNIIQCYAPTNDRNDDIKDQFYEWLQSIIKKCPRKDLTILMGDLNAKIEL